MAARKRTPDTGQKFDVPKDFKFLVYTNKEITAIVTEYINDLYNLNLGEISTEKINKMIVIIDRIKFLIQQIKQSKP